MVATPCTSCPFRKDKPIYLRRGRRAEIAQALLSGQSFWCHGTVDYDGDEDEWGEVEPNTANAKMCAGAEKALMAIGQSSQMGRIAERLGLVDLDRQEARGAEVWDLHEWQRLNEGATADNPEGDGDDDEGEPCGTVGPNCIAPAGFLVGGGVVEGTEAADSECTECGEPLCSECADAQGRCGLCTEEED